LRKDINVAKDLPNRDEIPREEQWDAFSIFSSHQQWESSFKKISVQITELARFKGNLSQGPTQLMEWFDTIQALYKELFRIYIYASLFHNVDTADQEAAAREGRAQGLMSEAMAATAFAEPELLELSQQQLDRWMSADPRLQSYRHYFRNLERRRQHIRSEEVEELLGLVTDPFTSASTIHGILSDAELTFAPATSSDNNGASSTVAQGTIDTLLGHTDREVRRSAWESYADAHLGVQNTMAGCLATCVKQHIVTARARRYSSCLEAALAEDNIPTSVFHSFLDAFRNNLPIWHRYFKIRRRFFGYDSLHVYDLKAPLSTNPPKIPFDQALKWICQGLEPLGQEYVSVMRRGVEQDRWVDARPNRGKRSGAFSIGAKGTNPFILMSYTDDVYSLSTLAHELGHSMHSYLTWQRQPMIYSEYSIFAAEVASNFNQALVRAHLLQTTHEDRDFQIALLEEALSNFHRYFLLMPTLARFELAIHQRGEKGDSLTAGDMSSILASLFAEAYGDEVAMDTERIGITWAQFATHLYSNFYVYQYGTGISAAHTLAHHVLRDYPGAVDDYLEFLGAGASEYPIDLLRRAGVDLTDPEPVERAFDALSDLVSRLEFWLEI
jgi:oligoendopeptidase F